MSCEDRPASALADCPCLAPTARLRLLRLWSVCAARAWSIPEAFAPGDTVRMSGSQTYDTVSVSSWLHCGRSNVQSFTPGVSGTMRASSIVVPHLAHGRSLGKIDLGCTEAMTGSPVAGGSAVGSLNHRRLWQSLGR